MRKEEIQQLADRLLPLIAEKKALQTFSLSEAEAESFGAFEETALTEEELDDFYEEFVRNSFIKSSKGGNR